MAMPEWCHSDPIHRSLVEQRFALGLGGDHRAAGIAEDIDRRFERANEAGAPLGGLNFTLATRASSPGGWPELEAVKKAVN